MSVQSYSFISLIVVEVVPPAVRPVVIILIRVRGLQRRKFLRVSSISTTIGLELPGSSYTVSTYIVNRVTLTV